MRKLALAVALAAAATGFATAAQAQSPANPWQFHLRAAQLNPTGSTDGIGIESKAIPDISIGYFLTRNVALDLLLTTPQKHEVELNGAPLGSVKHLPPTLFAQYHFAPDARVRPYAGAGINYTRFLDRTVGPARLESSSIGPAVQVGADYMLDRNWSVNVDLKKLWIKADVENIPGLTATVNPILFAVGVGYRY